MIVAASIVRGCGRIAEMTRMGQAGSQHVSISSYTVLPSFDLIRKVIYNYSFLIGVPPSEFSV
jgi:hypothetical protein